MAAPLSRHLQEVETIDYIKKIAESLEQQQKQSSSKLDSLAISESEPSETTIRIPIRRNPQPKPTYANRYVSPYRQNALSIRRIEASGRRQVSPQVSFSNTLLQIATSREQTASRENTSPSRYKSNASMMDRLELSALGTLRAEARKMYEVQEQQRLQMTPRQANEKWADFLLRERKWEEERRRRQMDIRQQALAEQRIRSNRVTERPREVSGLTREEMIRKVKREKSKLQERLSEISLQSYNWKNVNIRSGVMSPMKPRATSNKLIISDPKEAYFLVQR